MKERNMHGCMKLPREKTWVKANGTTPNSCYMGRHGEAPDGSTAT